MENFRVKIKNIFRNFQLSSKGYDEKNEKIITLKLNRILRNLAIIILLSYLTLIYNYVALGLYYTHRFEWPFFQKLLCTNIVKQLVFL